MGFLSTVMVLGPWLEHALQYQVDILGDMEATSVDLFSDPILRLTRVQKRLLKVILAGYSCNPFCTVNPFRKGHDDPAAWLAHEALKILDGPNVNPDMVIAENATSWANDPKVPTRAGVWEPNMDTPCKSSESSYPTT